jgi:peroxiredoxin Q/BCP
MPEPELGGVARGSNAPQFTLTSTAGEVSLAPLLDGRKRVVLAFFSEVGTPACDTLVAMLKDAHEMITEFGGTVIAVSADGIESLRAFAERLGGVPFPLATDTNLEAARAYGVIDEADTRHARRAVFVIDRDGAVLLANPHFQASNLSQVEAIFSALGEE